MTPARLHIKNVVFLCVSIIAVHFQLVFKIFYTKWDNLSAFFPYRYTANHFWRAGELPLWDFYQNLGYPMHANPQGYVWYPITQFFAFFGEYSPYFMNLELVLHLCIAAIGVYFLFFYLGIASHASLIAGLSFGLSGFTTGSSHMIGFTIAAAWLPWVLWYVLKCLKEESTQNYVALAMLGFLHVTGAYSAFSVVLLYIVVGIIASHYVKKQVSNPLKTLTKLLVISLPLFALLASPYLYSIFDSLPYFSRATPLSYDPTHFARNFSFECFQSLLFPYINSSKNGFWEVDVSLANIYIGSFLFLGAIGYLLTSKDKNKIILFLALCIFWLLSLGIHTPVHKIAFSLLPGFNVFRHPYLFTLYSTLLLIYMGARYLSTAHLHTKTLLKIGLVFILIIVLIALPAADFSLYSTFWDAWYSLQEKSPLNKYSHIAMQGIVLVLLFSAMLCIKSKKHTALVVIVLVDLALAVQLNGPLTMYYNVPTAAIDAHLSKISNPSLTNQAAYTPLGVLSNKTIENTAGLWVNLNTFTRTTGVDGYNPFIFKTLADLSKQTLADSIAFFGLVRGEGVHQLKLGYNSIEFEIESEKSQTLTIQQNYHHRWFATVNQIPVELSPNAYGLITLKTPSKEIGTVRLVYDNRALRILFVISSLIFCLSWVFLLFFAKHISFLFNSKT